MRITKDPAVRRQEIVEQARLQFEARGISKTSMNEIAVGVGVAKGLIYYYFPSKEHLVEEVISQFIQELDESLSQIIQRGDLDFYAKLTAILELYFSAIRSHPTVMVFSPADPGVFSLIRERMSEIALRHAGVLLQQGMQQNLIQIRYPEHMLRMLIRGLGDLYIEGVRQLPILVTLIEQTLGLEKERLYLNERCLSGPD
ncbi:MAG TPA: hypothetical protein DD640_00350 [Clostridiales bacterium]|nr:hypothetical protein [Clostridiales bacterium]